MKYIKQSAVILGITWVGEWMSETLPLPVPAGVYGLFLMLILFCTGVLRVEQVEEAGNFLLDIMPVLFVPAAVGLMESYEQIQRVLAPMMVICVVSTIVVMVVTGKVADGIMGRKDKEKRGKKA
ncbi:CidA/LrgA family protein [Clostridiaceae bacterium]|jgi:Putative effector of murein hydrolase LrgA|nr:CidA/LrgA family protein [Lachnospiraceae bacterium]NBH16326.1 CidA/LrgA family protein [Clostridiaceae bacterium]